MKEACRELGIATPAYVIAENEADIERAADTLRFPLFVKHYSSYASVDLSRRSRVRTREGLRIQARKIMSRHGAALIEEYVDGIECTVLVAENPEDPASPITYTPAQYKFPEGEHFKHSNLKWVDYEGLSSFPVPDPVLAARLRDECSRFFVKLKAASFGRCDLRVDRDGTPYMLEINANCGIYYPPADYGSADICLSLDPAGHEGFTRLLVAAAFARHERIQVDDRTAGSEEGTLPESPPYDGCPEEVAAPTTQPLESAAGPGPMDELIPGSENGHGMPISRPADFEAGPSEPGMSFE